MTFRFRHFQPKNRLLSVFILIFHLSIVQFLISLALVPFLPMIAKVIVQALSDLMRTVK